MGGWQFIQAPIDGLTKLLERAVVTGIQHRLFGESPEPLDKIEEVKRGRDEY